ncbi:uncharacterized protein LOC126549386 isoform X2 [Aphis gossypii]|uniref:uncharacterized protein LOC126549386 isoform X2 n=1 Tax=Aphis gossypii TaxID=80765 RepID=UPI002158BC3E|nr:uncharacterized protein LOC126549386 isoform X2 [Aphis gossypii]
MYTRKNENEQLENLLSQYFKTRSFFPYGAVKDDKSKFVNDGSTYRQNSLVHQKYSKLKSPIFEFNTFCSMTSLHGFSHFVENNFNKIGKYFWAIILIFIYILCGVSIYFLIRMFSEMPAIISLDNSVSSIWAIPFPAVTVCSANQVRSSVYNSYSDINITDYEDQFIQNTIHGVCENNPINKNWKSYDDYLDGSFVSQVLKESTIIVIILLVLSVFIFFKCAHYIVLVYLFNRARFEHVYVFK